MSFVFKKDEAAIAAATAGGSLDTGVHSVTITGAYLVQDASDNYRMDLELESNTGAKASIYGLCVQEKWNTGKDNFDYPRFQELVAVTNPAFTGAVVDGKRKNFEGKENDAKILTELVGKSFMVAIQIELDYYNGKEKILRKLNRSFFADGTTTAEKAAGAPALTSEKLKTTLKDYSNKRHQAFLAGGSPTAGVASAADTTAQDDDIEL